MRLTAREIALIFEALREKYGPGYTGNTEVDTLQAKLSIMGEVAAKFDKPESEASK